MLRKTAPCTVPQCRRKDLHPLGMEAMFTRQQLNQTRPKSLNELKFHI